MDDLLLTNCYMINHYELLRLLLTIMTYMQPWWSSNCNTHPGVSKLAASMAPSVLPAPINKCAWSGKRYAVCVPVGSIGLLQVSPRGMGNTEYNNHRFSPTWLWHLCGGIWLPCRFSDAMKLWVQALIAAKCKSDLLYRENTRAFQKVCLAKIPVCLARKRNS